MWMALLAGTYYGLKAQMSNIVFVFYAIHNFCYLFYDIIEVNLLYL